MSSLLEEKYISLEKKYRILLRNSNVTYTSPVNFQESMKTARHRWFPYKEGFSPTFVADFLQRYGPSGHAHILDPFAGVGTTLIESANMGFDSTGFEVNPLAHFIATVKSLSFSNDERAELSKAIGLFAAHKLNDIHPSPDNATVVSYFEQEALEALLKLKQFYKFELDGKVQQIFKLVFLRLIEDFSTHRKAGNGVKKRTRLLYNNSNKSITELLRETALVYLKIIADDLEKPFRTEMVRIIPTSCLDENKYPPTMFDSVLTSPPYANCFDYSKIYLSELWLGDFFTSKDCQIDFRKRSIRSHVHARWEGRHEGYGSSIVEENIQPLLFEKKLWSAQIPHMLKGYFDDIGYLLQMLRNKLHDHSLVGLVVSNSAYAGIPIATDLLITEVGEKHGYKPVCVEVYRSIIPSSQQYQSEANKKYFRESLVVLKKT